MSDSIHAKTVCFSGRRIIAPAKRQQLEHALFNIIKTLAESGYANFICGGALGFDTLAAIAVIKRKYEYNIKLSLAIPHKGQEETWGKNDIKLYSYIINHSDNVLYLADKYYDGCMQARNRYMVDNAALLVAYSTGIHGGTAYTCAYAANKGKEIIHL